MAQQVSITTLNRWAKYAKDVADYMGNQLSAGDTIPTEINQFLKNSGFDQARKQEIKDDPYYFNNIKKVAEAVNGNDVNSLGNTGPKSSMGTSFGGGGGATVTGTVKENKLDPALLKLKDLARLKKNSKRVKHFYSLEAPRDLNFVLHGATSDPILLTGSQSDYVVPTWSGQTAEEIRGELDEAYGGREKWLGSPEWGDNLAIDNSATTADLSKTASPIVTKPYVQELEADTNPAQADVSLLLDPRAKSTRDLIKDMNAGQYDELRSNEMTKYIDLRWVKGHAFSKLSEEDFDNKVRLAIAHLDMVREMVSGGGNLLVITETTNQDLNNKPAPKIEGVVDPLISSVQKTQDTAIEKVFNPAGEYEEADENGEYYSDKVAQKVFNPTGEYEEADENGEYYSDKVAQKVFNPTGEYEEANENGEKAIEKVSVSVDQVDGEDVLEVVHTKPQTQSEDNVVSISSDLNDPQIISMIVSLTDDGYSKFYDNEMDKLITFGAFNDYNDPAGRFLTEAEFDVFLWKKLAMVDRVRDGSITQANEKAPIPVDLSSSAQKEQDAAIEKVFSPTGEYKEVDENEKKAIEKVSVSVDPVVVKEIFEDEDPKKQWRTHFNTMSSEMFESIDAGELEEKYGSNAIYAYSNRWEVRFNEMSQGEFTSLDPKLYSKEKYSFYALDAYLERRLSHGHAETQGSKKVLASIPVISSAQKAQDATMEKVFNPTGEYEEADENGEYYSDKVAQKVFNSTGEYEEADENGEYYSDKVAQKVFNSTGEYEEADENGEYYSDKVAQTVFNPTGEYKEATASGDHAVDKVVVDTVIAKEVLDDDVLPVLTDLTNIQVISMIKSMTATEYTDFYDKEFDSLITIGMAQEYNDPAGKYSNYSEHGKYFWDVLGKIEFIRNGEVSEDVQEITISNEPVQTPEQKLSNLKTWLNEVPDTSGFGKMSADDYDTWWKSLYDKFVVKFIDEDTPEAVDSEMSRRIQGFYQQWEDAVKAQPELDMKEILAKANKNQNIQMPGETMADFKAKIENIEIDNQEKLAVQQENDASLMQALIKARRASKIAQVFKKPTGLPTGALATIDKTRTSTKPETDISKAIEAVADVIPEEVKDKLSEAGVYFTKGDFSKDYKETKSTVKNTATALLTSVSGWLSADDDKKDASAKSTAESLDPKSKTVQTRRGARRKSSAKEAITPVKPKPKTVQTRRGGRRKSSAKEAITPVKPKPKTVQTRRGGRRKRR